MLNSIVKKIFYSLFKLNYKLKNEQIEYFLINLYGKIFQYDTTVVTINKPSLKIIKIFEKKLIIQFNEDSIDPFKIETDDFTLCYDGKKLYKKEKNVDTPIYLDLNHFKVNNKIQIVMLLTDDDR